MQRIVALNVRSGGGTRVERLCQYLGAQNPHTVVLTEWRCNTSGRSLEDGLKAEQCESGERDSPERR